MTEKLGIGSTVWHFDQNRRVYTDAPKDRIWGDLIYREHWHPVEITGENRRSWITSYGKAPKNGSHRGWAFSQAEVDDDCWRDEHRSWIGDLRDTVRRCRDRGILRQIAALVGYGEAK